jgi:hypothetical protein
LEGARDAGTIDPGNDSGQALLDLLSEGCVGQGFDRWLGIAGFSGNHIKKRIDCCRLAGQGDA